MLRPSPNHRTQRLRNDEIMMMSFSNKDRDKGTNDTYCLECIVTFIDFFARAIHYCSPRTTRSCPNEGDCCVTFTDKTVALCI